MKSTKHGSQVRIWHPLIRAVHWSLVVIFTANYFVLEAGSQWHQWLGYSAATLIILRVLWGFIDTGFGNFKTVELSRQAFKNHFEHLKQRRVPLNSGHNPLGWLMVFAVIALFLGLAITGFMMEEIDRFFGNSTLEEIHEWLANILYAAALVHVTAVVLTGWRGRIELIRPMLTGQRRRR